MEEKIESKKIENFLYEVDGSFPIPLSQKQTLSVFAQKLCMKATLCTEIVDDKIVAAVAGYTDNVLEKRGYISLVATIPEYQGKGLASKLLKQFLKIARGKNLDAVHLYTVPANTAAVEMYKKLGFVKWQIPDEQRPNDLHLIYYLDGQEFRGKEYWEK